MTTIYCIALKGESTTGSLWFRAQDARDAALGANAADTEIPFRLEVKDGLSGDEITALVDHIESTDAYVPEANAGLSDNEQDILKVLRDERDEWTLIHEQLISQVQWARNYRHTKLADSLRYARDHADTMRQAASDMYDNVYAIIHPEG